MSKHTPGPWSIREVSKHGTSVDGFVGVGVAWCGANTTVGNKGAHSISESEAEANARLIAAAPELLDALTRMLKQFPADSDLYAAGWDSSAINEACDAYDAARAAVRKATGEA